MSRNFWSTTSSGSFNLSGWFPHPFCWLYCWLPLVCLHLFDFVYLAWERKLIFSLIHLRPSHAEYAIYRLICLSFLENSRLSSWWFFLAAMLESFALAYSALIRFHYSACLYWLDLRRGWAPSDFSLLVFTVVFLVTMKDSNVCLANWFRCVSQINP